MSSPLFDYRKEAETFVGVMKDIAPELKLDFSPESIDALEAFISKNFDPPGSKYFGNSLIAGVGCYVGEVVIRAVGGRWNEQGLAEINGIGEIKALFPIQKALKRFKNGPVDSLAHYYGTVLKYAPKK
jgi:hypothetical protein